MRHADGKPLYCFIIHDYVGLGLHIMNSNSWYNDFFFPCDVMHSAVLTQYIGLASVCLSAVCDLRVAALVMSHDVSDEIENSSLTIVKFVKIFVFSTSLVTNTLKCAKIREFNLFQICNL